jgi:hypothetical protein
MDFHGIETLGHVVHTGYIRKRLEKSYRWHVEYQAEKYPEDTPEEAAKRLALHTGPDALGSNPDTCGLCGSNVEFYLEDGPGSPIGVKCYPHSLPDFPLPLSEDDDKPDENGESRQYRWLSKMDFGAEPNFECPVKTMEPVVTRFISKSGRVALANDLRTAVGQGREAQDAGGPHIWTPYFKYHGERGNAEYIRQRASFGYLTGMVGNTHVWFVERDGVLMVKDISYESGEITDQLSMDLDEECIHSVSTSLWWFAIVEADMVDPEYTSEYDQPVFYDLPGGPGEYEFTYTHGNVFHAFDLSPAGKQAPPGEITWAMLRKVQD